MSLHPPGGTGHGWPGEAPCREDAGGAVVQVLVIDDHPLFREALRGAVTAVLEGAAIMEADGIAAACAVLEAERGVDLALLDLSMPGVAGFDGLITLRSRFPRVPVVIVSGHEDGRIVAEAIRLGAAGYIPKSLDRATLSTALQTVLAGSVYVPEATPSGAEESSDSLAARVAELTPQQLRVLQMIRQGLLNKQIAYELKIGETTVKAHVSEVLRKLKVVSRTQAVIETAKLDLAALMRKA